MRNELRLSLYMYICKYVSKYIYINIKEGEIFLNDGSSYILW